MNAQTFDLLKIIGSPFIDSIKEGELLNADGLFEYAKKNRMPLLYLKYASELGIKDKHTEDYLGLFNQWNEIEFRIKKVINHLDQSDISYYTFKSIKPYREVTVDIDLLISEHYEKAVRLLNDSGYIRLDRGPLSSTFRDPEYKIDYDIYNELGVSQIIYFDKDKVKDWIFQKPLETGGYINSLLPEIDLLAVIAHSVIKEQMYILAEYYTTLFYLENMNGEKIDNFIEMTRKLKLKCAVKAHIGITALIHKLVHRKVPRPLKKIIDNLGVDELEIHRLKKSQIKTPHKFHPITLVKSLSEKFTESKSRRSMAKQLQSMVNPTFTKSFIPQFISHVVRETY